MTQEKTGIAPAKWQVTTYCFWCDSAKNCVTLMVYSDWRVKCTHYEKYNPLRNEAERKQKLNDCPGPSCYYLAEYQNKLVQEEMGAK